MTLLPRFIIVVFCALTPSFAFAAACDAGDLDRVRGQLLSPHAAEMASPDAEDLPALRCLASRSEPMSIVRRRARSVLGSWGEPGDCAILLRPYVSSDPVWSVMESLDAMSYVPQCFGASGDLLLLREVLWGAGPKVLGAWRILIGGQVN